MSKVTMADVAAKAGVSKSTVSQYINNRYEYMAESTKNRIKQAIEELGYIPNFAAKSLKQKKSSTIGVIVANILHAFSTEIIRAIEDVCETSGFHLFVCNADDDPEKERGYIEMLMAKQVDGLIIFPTDGNSKYYETLRESNFPIVFLDRKIKKEIYPTIMLDNMKAAKMAVDLFAEAGKRKIAVVSTSLELNVTPRVERVQGYQNAMAAHGLPFDHKWVIATERKQIFNALQELWNSEHRPEAFFATNDLSLIEVLAFLQQNNIRIPNDVSVIGIDDSPFLKVVSPPITVIKQPTFEMGRDAARKLLNFISAETIPDKCEIHRYAPSLIKRQSV
jgi:LacI family kdg operon repressor